MEIINNMTEVSRPFNDASIIDKKGVYIAGKLNDQAVEYLHNVSKMMATAQQVKDAGYSVLVPALDLLMGIKFDYISYNDYFDNNLVWVRKADAVFLTPGWENSKGTEREIFHAIENGVPVFDRLDEMWEYFKGIQGGRIVKLVEKEKSITSPFAFNLAVKYREAYPERYAKEMEKIDKDFKKHGNTKTK
jgi:hypothetical protein